MAFLDARVLKNSAEQGAPLGNPFFAGGDSNNQDLGNPVIGQGQGGVAAAGDDNADDIDDNPPAGGPGVVAGGTGGAGGYDFGQQGNDGGGDTPDGVDTTNRNSPLRPMGRGDSVNMPNQRVSGNTAEEAGDPGQIVGSAGATGTTIGIVAGVVALVGVAAGVAIYVIKKRN